MQWRGLNRCIFTGIAQTASVCPARFLLPEPDFSIADFYLSFF